MQAKREPLTFISKRIRGKIKDTDSWSIQTVWGIGYKFEVKVII